MLSYMPNGDLERKIKDVGDQPINIFSDLYRILCRLTDITKEIKDYNTLFVDTTKLRGILDKFYRSLDWEPFEYYPTPVTSDGADYDDLDTELLESGYVYHLHNLVGYNAGSSITQCSLGYVSGANFMIMRKRSADNPFETVEYVGDIVLKPTDKIRIRFHDAEDGDKLYLFANGIRRRA